MQRNIGTGASVSTAFTHLRESLRDPAERLVVTAHRDALDIADVTIVALSGKNRSFRCETSAPHSACVCVCVCVYKGIVECINVVSGDRVLER